MSTEKPSAASNSSMVNATAVPGEQVDDLSFEDFYRNEKTKVLGLAFVLIGNKWVAEDTVQDAFVAAFRKWNSVSQYDAPEAWLRRVICNQSASVVRRRMREAKALLLLASRRHEDIVLEESDEQFWHTVRKLPTRQAQVVALHYMEDMSVAQIADVLDCSDGTVKTHLSRARSFVAHELKLEDNG